jgi:hypothetical protein
MLREYILSLLTVVLLSVETAYSREERAEATADAMDPVRISLLTCEAGEEIYSLFGHTAIRYEDCSNGQDVVLNYGLFSFDTPNFILRFALGKTDYRLGMVDYNNFIAEYAFYGRDVRQQTLALTAEEKYRLAALLSENLLPENRIYRYNFFYDNCATRPRDKVEEAVAGSITYGNLLDDGETVSFRDLIHRYAADHPWARFGIDMCLGSEADRPVTEREMMFVPFYLERAVADAVVKDAGGERKLVASSETLLDNDVRGDEARGISDVMTPMRASLLLFVVVALLTVYGLKRERALWVLDALLFAAAGVAGCVIAFLVFFSEHPAVSPNYLLLVFHPLHLLFLPYILYGEIKHRLSYYHAVNLLVLTLFIVLYPVIPQRFDLAVVPLALCLLARSLSNLILNYKRTE